jgi:alcohol dehydrogenase class IV
MVVPDVALIDPVTTTTMDAELTAFTGMDALVHGIEAFVSNANSPITDLHALKAIHLVMENLIPAAANLDDIGLRTQMMLGSLHAGMAFSNTSLGAVHAMAHSLGGVLDFPHGETNAILLEHVISYNFETAFDRYVRIGQAMGMDLKPGEEKEAILNAIRQLGKALGISQTLGQIGLSRGDIPALAKNAMQDACMVTNPRRPVQRDIEVIYEKAL